MSYDNENISAETVLLDDSAGAQPSEKVGSINVAEETKAAEQHRTRKKYPIILTIAGVLVVAVIAVILLMRSGRTEVSAPEEGIILAYLDGNGNGYIPMRNGKVIEIEENLESAFITEDMQYLFVFLKDGTFYVTDPEQNNRTIVADHVSPNSVWRRSDGIVYEDEDGILYKALFPKLESIEIGKVAMFKMALNTVSLIYVSDSGEIFTMAANSEERIKVGQIDNMAVYEDDSVSFGEYDTQVTLEMLSDDCQIYAWEERSKEGTTVYYNDGDNRSCFICESKYGCDIAFSEDNKLAVVADEVGNGLWIKKAGEDAVEVKLPNEISSYPIIYTKNGHLNIEKAVDVESIYVAAQMESDYIIYNITLDGERERMLSKIKDYYICDGNIWYLDSEGDFYYGRLDGDEIVNCKKVDSNVNSFEKNIKNYVYFWKDFDDIERRATLYCYKVGSEEAVMVASEVACWHYDYDLGNVYSADQATVYFLKDTEEIESVYSDYGTLMKWTYGDESPTRIASEVMRRSLYTGYPAGYPVGMIDNGNRFWYLKYSYMDSDGHPIANLMYFDGEGAQKVKADLTTKNWYY